MGESGQTGAGNSGSSEVFVMNRRYLFRLSALFLMLALTACGREEGPNTLVIPTPIIAPPEPTGAVPATLPTTVLPTTTPTAVPATSTITSATSTLVAPTAVATPLAQNGLYRVVFVTADDVLNVRSGPGANNPITGTLPPGTTGIRITGSGQVVAGSTWVPVVAGNVAGWVNSRFLTLEIAPENFCQDEAVQEVLETLKTAVTRQDGAQLAQLVHPERGLRIHHAWWNPAVHLNRNEVSTIFTTATRYNWGVEDGSGFDLTGPFNQQILPLLQQDLLPATEQACNDILHGATAGLIQLPDGYQRMNFYSLFRPADDTIEFDWGTWVVGIEQWQGTYYISYLVHYAYEI